MTVALGTVHVLVDSVELAAAALRGGATVLQVRTKVGTDRERLALVRGVAGRCRAAGALCVVNDRADLALAGGAHGVHLGAEDLPVAVARALAPQLLIGGTARNPETAQRLVSEGADYLGVGPVWATTSKAGLPDPIGTEGLEAVARSVPAPVIAISGVTAERLPAALRAGAAGVAVIGAVSKAPDPATATRELVEALDRERIP
ncbi:MAG TPA: thiamine phosphate synthase [Acidimicrobiales bacterium]|nr:thiamine phosphate synthase [Acidimicrobiales bacterium]